MRLATVGPLSGTSAVDGSIAPFFTRPTLEELNGENRHYFEGGGGEKFAYLPALNDSDEGVRVIEAVVRRELSGWI